MRLTFIRAGLYMLGALGLSLFLGIVIGMAFYMYFTHADPGAHPSEITLRLKSSLPLLFITVWASEVVLLILGSRIQKRSGIFVNWNSPFNPSVLFLIVAVLAFALSFVVVSSEIENWMASLLGRNLAFTQPLVTMAIAPGTRGFLLAIIHIVLLPAIVEEYFFRGVLQSGLSERYGPKKALLFTSLFFSVFHLNPTVMISVFLGSLMLGILYQKTGSLLFPMGLHLLNNLITVFLLRYQDFEIQGLNTPAGQVAHVEAALLVPALALCLVAAFVIYKLRVSRISLL